MCIKKYTLYVDENDKIIKIISHAMRVACQSAMILVDDEVELIRVRD
jgi:hypothetical protein